MAVLDDIKWSGYDTFSELNTWGIAPLQAMTEAVRSWLDNCEGDGAEKACTMIYMMLDHLEALERLITRLEGETMAKKIKK